MKDAAGGFLIVVDEVSSEKTRSLCLKNALTSTNGPNLRRQRSSRDSNSGTKLGEGG